jgi:cytochrome c-type biogenesis protein CcmE
MTMARQPRRALTAKRRRLYILVAAAITLGGAAMLVLNAFEESLVFFLTPTDLKEKTVSTNRVIRIGGLVEKGSVRKTDGLVVRFAITDLTNRVNVRYRGILPDLFREGQGVVTQGRMGADGVFAANEVLAKHDETYMPKEVAEALKKSGQWKPSDKAKGAVPAMEKNR